MYPRIPSLLSTSIRAWIVPVCLSFSIISADAHAEVKLLVQPGQTLHRIARDYNTTVDKIKALNGLKSDVLPAGKVLRLPEVAAISAPVSTPIAAPVEKPKLELRKEALAATSASPVATAASTQKEAEPLSNTPIPVTKEEIRTPLPAVPVTAIASTAPEEALHTVPVPVSRELAQNAEETLALPAPVSKKEEHANVLSEAHATIPPHRLVPVFPVKKPIEETVEEAKNMDELVGPMPEDTASAEPKVIPTPILREVLVGVLPTAPVSNEVASNEMMTEKADLVAPTFIGPEKPAELDTALAVEGTSEEAVPVVLNTAETAPAPVTQVAKIPTPVLRPDIKESRIASELVPDPNTARLFTPSQYGFIWPTNGKVISRFGPKEGGLHNDGINIKAPYGSPVRAAADGTVVYAGNELRGYGNLLVVKHDQGYMSAYAHLADMMVKKGDQLRRGTLIGHIGNTGNIDTAQLHFGIRKGKKALDPEQYLTDSNSQYGALN